MADARTERWATHRVQMRRQLVESAMTAIDHLGPQISMRELAAEAKIPKPTLYRFFTDKSELVEAINDQMMEILTERIVTGPQLSASTVGEFLRSALEGYAHFIDDHPNIFRFLMLNMSAMPGSSAARTHAIETSRTMNTDIAEILTAVVVPPGESAKNVEMSSAMIMGGMWFAADLWIGEGDARSSVTTFVDQVEPHIRATLEVTAGLNEVELDFEAPISEVFARAMDYYGADSGR